MRKHNATRIVFSGHVQGVGFRWFVQRTAQKLNITGRVQNLPDGTVEAVCEGSDDAISQLIDACKRYTELRAISQENVSVRDKQASFTIDYSMNSSQ